MSKITGILIILFLVISAVIGGLFGKIAKSSADTSLTPEKVSADYRQAIEVIDANYGGTVNHEQAFRKFNPKYALDA